MRNMNGSAAAVKTMAVGGVHDGRAEELADGVEVIGGARHDVAGAVGVVEAGRLAFEVGEEVVAEVELDLARGADDDLAGDVEEDRGERGDAARRRRAWWTILASVTPCFMSSMAWPTMSGMSTRTTL